METLQAGWQKPAGSDVSSRRRSAPRAPGSSAIISWILHEAHKSHPTYQPTVLGQAFPGFQNIIQYLLYAIYAHLTLQSKWSCPRSVTSFMDGHSGELLVLDSPEDFDTFESWAVIFATTIMCRIGVALERNSDLKNQPVSYVSSISCSKICLGGYPHSFDVSWHNDFVGELFPRL